ncbi:unnamed protein product [marine sediment metagenome]|uniref:Uncharacterized protein n=1 Tax=marine sediment metagenome TaxID=412755 RepID=X0WH66_9ZZZZ
MATPSGGINHDGYRGGEYCDGYGRCRDSEETESEDPRNGARRGGRRRDPC